MSKICLILGLLILPSIANAVSYQGSKPMESRDIEKEAAEIVSMKQVKDELRDILTEMSKCGTGSCNNETSLSICDYVALVDIQLNGEIGTGMISDKIPAFTTTKADKELLKRIAKSCIMSSYQHWNYPMFTHVRFYPNTKDCKWIYKQLGLKPDCG